MKKLDPPTALADLTQSQSRIEEMQRDAQQLRELAEICATALRVLESRASAEPVPQDKRALAAARSRAGAWRQVRLALRDAEVLEARLAAEQQARDKAAADAAERRRAGQKPLLVWTGNRTIH